MIYATDEALLAQQLAGLDEGGTPSLDRRPVLLGTPVGQSPLNQLSASVAADTLLFGAPRPQLRELRWVDRRDGTQSTFVADVDAWDLRIAPSGGAVAVTQRDPQLGTLDIWADDGGRPLPRRISRAIDIDESVVWSADGSRLAWVQGRRTIATRGRLAQLPEQTVRKLDTPVRLWDWSPDAEHFILAATRPATKDDILLTPATGTGDPVAYVQSPFNETHAVVSPDGEWIAYASDESGQPEVYVDTFPTPGRRGRVTVGGGTEPRWSAAPSRPTQDRPERRAELFFRRGSEIHVISLAFADAPEARSTTRLFDAGGDIRAYDVTADAKRVLVNVPVGGAKPPPINVIVNWRSLLASPLSGGPK